MGGDRERLRFGWKMLACALPAALAASVALAGSASAYIYVGNGPHIVRANNDGTGVNSDFIAVDGFVCGVAVDSTHVYWTDLNSVGRANLDGTNVQQDLYTIADPAKSFCGVALDGSHVYWVERQSNTIGRADLDGGNPQPSLFTAASQPCGIAVDGTYAYFAPNASGPIARFPKDGGAPVPMGWATGSAACSIAVSDKAVYYADHNASGATPIHAAMTTSMSVLADVPGAIGPCGIAVTPAALYWANDPSGGGSVGTVALGSDGSAVGAPNQNLLTGLNAPCGVAVDALPLPQGGGPSPADGGPSPAAGEPSPADGNPLAPAILPALVAVVGRESLSPTAFRAAPSGPSAKAVRTYGTIVTYTLNVAASVRFTVQKSVPGRKVKHGSKTTCDRPTKKNVANKKCKRLVTLKGSFTRNGVADVNKFRFTGRLNGKRLPPGKYLLVATPKADGKTGRPTKASFKIIP